MRPSDRFAAIGPWLRLLWNVAPPLLQVHGPDADGAVPWLSRAGLHLPPLPAGLDEDAGGRWLRAASAHAAAHLVFSRSVFVRDGVPAITWAQTGLLEDARAEALAARELPGLARLWAAHHSATSEDGDGFEALLARLARALADVGYEDPHPWVRKGRTLFWRDAAQQVLAEPDAKAMRALASRLGHDLGQMRMGLNTRTYRPAPSYRDDNRWLWHAECVQAAAKHVPAPALAGRPKANVAVQHAGEKLLWRYPEWDARAAILRRDWCTVLEGQAPVGDVEEGGRWQVPPAQLVCDIVRASRCTSRPLTSAAPGDGLHVDGVVRWATTRRGRLPEPVARFYLRKTPTRRSSVALLLVDASASSAVAAPDGGPSAFSRQCAQAAVLAQAMQRAGWQVAIHGFHSDGRHRVHVQRVLDFGGPWDAIAAARLANIRPGLSTRLGAVVRHATRTLLTQSAEARWTLVIGDGEPHDIDVPDARYLVADAHAAVTAARRSGVSVACLHPGPNPAVQATLDVFGRATTILVDGWNPTSLRRALARLMA